MTPHGIKGFLAKKVPTIGPTLAKMEPVPLLRPAETPVIQSVVRIITGQMLSKEAARTIYSRLQAAQDQQDLTGIWELRTPSLKKAGLSANKCKAIKRFAAQYKKDAKSIEAWRDLCWPDLQKAVSAHWGLSTWSASILGLSHFGHEDIFPDHDGSIRRAVQLLSNKRRPFDPSNAAPYRSYLALYLWESLDNGLLK